MNKQVTFAIVGFGHIGKRHMDILAAHPGCKLIAVAETDAERRKAAAQYLSAVPTAQAGEVRCFDSLDKLLASPEAKKVDVVNICTPNGLHADQAIQALNHKCHVVCEKPMGLSKAKCEEVIHTALKMSKHVFCVMQNRYSPPAQWLKEVMEANRLGKIYMVQINCYWNRDERYYGKSGWKGTLKLDGGPLFTQFSHFVDMMYWLFGDVKNINARFDNFNHRDNTEFEDSGYVNFEFVKGGLGCFNYSTAVHETNLESSLTIIGEKGTIKVGGQYMDKVEYCNIQGYEIPELKPSNPPNDYGSYKGSAANHAYVFENVVKTLNGSTSVTTNALEGLKVVEIIERIYQLRNKVQISSSPFPAPAGRKK